MKPGQHTKRSRSFAIGHNQAFAGWQQIWATSLIALAFLTCFSIQIRAETSPETLLQGHRSSLGCWLADIDNSELMEKVIIIDLGVQKLYGFICSTSLSGDSYRFYQVENNRDEWAKLLSFPKLDSKLGWFAATQLEKPTWDEKNKLLRSEVPKQGGTSTCRQFSIYGWQKGQFHIAQVGLSGACDEKEGDKDMIIYPFVEEVEEGQASGQPKAAKDEKTAPQS